MTMSWKTICTTRYDRIDADRRLERIWALGGIAFDPMRTLAVAAKMRAKGDALWAPKVDESFYINWRPSMLSGIECAGERF